MTPPRSQVTQCSATPHLCGRAARAGEFCVLDVASHVAVAMTSAAEARRLAERNYPGCTLGLTSTTELRVRETSSADAPAIAVLQLTTWPIPSVVAVILCRGPRGPGCIPFEAEVWPDVVAMPGAFTLPMPTDDE